MSNSLELYYEIHEAFSYFELLFAFLDVLVGTLYLAFSQHSSHANLWVPHLSSDISHSHIVRSKTCLVGHIKGFDDSQCQDFCQKAELNI